MNDTAAKYSMHVTKKLATTIFEHAANIQDIQWPELEHMDALAYIRVSTPSYGAFRGSPESVYMHLVESVAGMKLFFNRILALQPYKLRTRDEICSLCLALMSKMDPALYQVMLITMRRMK